MGGSRSGRVRRICKSYDLNSTRHIVKEKFITQPSPSTLKNQPNLANYIGLGRFWRVHYTPLS